ATDRVLVTTGDDLPVRRRAPRPSLNKHTKDLARKKPSIVRRGNRGPAAVGSSKCKSPSMTTKTRVAAIGGDKSRSCRRLWRTPLSFLEGRPRCLRHIQRGNPSPARRPASPAPDRNIPHYGRCV